VREALEVVGQANYLLQRRFLRGGSTVLRLIDCPNFRLEHFTLAAPLGPPDPDGQCLQLIRSWGTILGLVCYASDAAEDLVSVYADRPVHGVVTIDGLTTFGRGKSDSGTSLCLDGPWCPTTIVKNFRFVGARCAVTIAGGVNHRVGPGVFENCDNRVYVHPFYRGPFGGFSFPGIDPADVLSDLAALPRAA
jgi:hypothetical protein